MLLNSRSTQATLRAGIPCWVEIATSHEATAQRFYHSLFGWTYQTHPDPATRNGQYSIASIDGVPVGGLYRAAVRQPLGWTLHISVRSTTRAAHWIEHLGGKVILGPITISHRGSILHAVDPTGAPIVFWQPSGSWTFGNSEPNMFVAADLNTHDGKSADYFFSKLFNYQVHQVGDVINVDYTEWRLDNEPVLYRYLMGSEYRPETPPHWMVYFQADPDLGVDVMASQAARIGGTIVVSPYDTPWGRLAVIADPDGSVFSLIDHSQIAYGWRGSPLDEDDED